MVKERPIRARHGSVAVFRSDDPEVCLFRDYRDFRRLVEGAPVRNRADHTKVMHAEGDVRRQRHRHVEPALRADGERGKSLAVEGDLNGRSRLHGSNLQHDMAARDALDEVGVQDRAEGRAPRLPLAQDASGLLDTPTTV